MYFLLSKYKFVSFFQSQSCMNYKKISKVKLFLAIYKSKYYFAKKKKIKYYLKIVF